MVRRIFLYNNSKGYVTSPFPFSGTTPTPFQKQKNENFINNKNTHILTPHNGKQEANGPHRSPQKTFKSMNTFERSND